MRNTINNSTASLAAVILALGSTASIAVAGSIFTPPSDDQVRALPGGLASDGPFSSDSGPLAHTDQGPAKPGPTPLVAPPGGELDNVYFGLGDDLLDAAFLLDNDPGSSGFAPPTFGSLDELRPNVDSASSPSSGGGFSQPGAPGVPSPGSLTLIGLAGAIGAMQRRRSK